MFKSVDRDRCYQYGHKTDIKPSFYIYNTRLRDYKWQPISDYSGSPFNTTS